MGCSEGDNVGVLVVSDGGCVGLGVNVGELVGCLVGLSDGDLEGN